MKSSYSRSLIVGSLMWAASIQYYVLQFIVAAVWNKEAGYSWARHTISDLANTACAPYGNRLVCSPLHDVMNISFIALGVTMIIGAGLISRQISGSVIARIGFGCMMLAGLGTLLVGLFPENNPGNGHIIGATVAFIIGNVGPIIIGLSCGLILPVWLRVYSVLTGIVGLLALILFLLQIYVGLGIGGMERIVAYPQSVWMIIFGAYVFAQAMKLKTKSDFRSSGDLKNLQ